MGRVRTTMFTDREQHGHRHIEVGFELKFKRKLRRRWNGVDNHASA